MVLYIEKPKEHVKTTQTKNKFSNFAEYNMKTAEVDMGIKIHSSGRKL